MTWRAHVTFWLVAFVVLIAVVWLLGDVLLPFIGGVVLAYLLNPATNRAERAGIPRWLAAGLLVGLVVFAFVLLILLMAPVIGTQLAAFIDDLPGYVRKLQSLLMDPSRPWLSRIVGDRVAAAENSPGTLVAQGAGLATAFLAKLWSGGTAILSVFSLLVIMPIVAFYFILDWPRIIASLEALVPRPDRDAVLTLARQTNTAIGGFVRGQTLVCLLLGIFYAAALSLTGLNFGLLIGLLSGLISFIPYVGSVTGFVLATGIALVQFWPDWIWVVVVAAIFLFGQFIEGNILIPKLVGDSVGLHPLWLMFALFAFGYLFGFVGLLLAVPLAAATGVLVRFAVRRYLESPIYTGKGP